MALIRPPGPPTAAIDWLDVEHRLGHRLPSDYRQIVEVYGPGAFDGFIWVLQPSAPHPHLDLVVLRRRQLAALRELQAEGEHVPYELEIGGGELTPWAITDNGDVCFWVRSSADDPDHWEVAVNEARGPGWAMYRVSASTFLVGVVSGALAVDLFPDDFPTASPVFERWSGIERWRR